MENLTITKESLLSRNEADFLFTEVDEETVLMNIHNSSYIGLNAVTTDIWKLLESSQSFKELLAGLVSLYEIDAEKCEQETQMVVKGMVRNKILKVA